MPGQASLYLAGLPPLQQNVTLVDGPEQTRSGPWPVTMWYGSEQELCELWESTGPSYRHPQVTGAISCGTMGL